MTEDNNNEDSLPTTHYISTADAQAMVDRYRNTIHANSLMEDNKPDSLCSTFTIADLRGFLDKMENEYEADGVRIYYGAYLPDYPVKKYRGRHNLIFVATKKIEDPTRCDDSTGTTTYIHEDILAYGGGLIEEPVNLAFNNGNLCPPPPPGFYDCESNGATLIKP